ncbi:VOC family protein [Streptomyces sp. SCSIO 30461]|uniref:VOC family protein n=1 Tax=Streptomyces sp. SCSIO 30461 TaxID=3118085 RepID=UPI0030D3E71B
MARDLHAAQHFYGAVLGWEFRTTSLGDEFSVAFLDGAPIAGIGALARSLAVAVEWIPYFAVDDADVTAARISERSATVAVGPISFGTGRAALAADRDGAVFGFWQGKVIPDWTVGRSRAPAWLELRTRDAFEAAIFYAEVFDWGSERPGGVQVSYEDEHVVLRHGPDKVARLTGGAVEAAPDPRVRPRWHVYFYVPDIDAAIDAATRLGGGAVTEPEIEDEDDVPPPPGPGHGPDDVPAAARRVMLRDPDGGLFTVTTRGPA